MKNGKGITLIALVITIIVLLILVGVSIAMLTGEGGILGKANSAKTEYEKAEKEEKEKLDKIENWMDKFEANDNHSTPLTADLFSFTPTDSNWEVKNVEEALNFLYNH